jgi:hypothetical protein
VICAVRTVLLLDLPQAVDNAMPPPGFRNAVDTAILD